MLWYSSHMEGRWEGSTLVISHIGYIHMKGKERPWVHLELKMGKKWINSWDFLQNPHPREGIMVNFVLALHLCPTLLPYAMVRSSLRLYSEGYFKKLPDITKMLTTLAFNYLAQKEPRFALQSLSYTWGLSEKQRLGCSGSTLCYNTIAAQLHTTLCSLFSGGMRERTGNEIDPMGWDKSYLPRQKRKTVTKMQQ